MVMQPSIAPRLIAAAPAEELERRWDIVRSRLRERQTDALLIVGHSNELDGAVRWLTDAPITYRRVVVVHAEELMTVYEHGSAGRVRRTDGQEPGYRGVGEIVAMATFSSVDYTQLYEATAICEMVRSRGYRRIALYHPMGLPYGFLRLLRTELEDVEFIDETEFIDRSKAIKSAAEIAVLEQSAAIQDEVMARTLAHAKPGMRDFEVSAYAFYQARLLGGDFGITLAGSAPPGEPGFMRGSEQQGRTIQPGDAMALLVENGGPGGYFLELGRTVSFGPAPDALKEAFAVAKAAQDFTLSLMKPGAACSDIYGAYTDYLAGHGLPPETRLYAHGQGYDLIERPLIRQDESMTLEAGMCLAVHPGVVMKGAFVFTCDNVLVEEGGARVLHKTPQQLIEL